MGLYQGSISLSSGGGTQTENVSEEINLHNISTEAHSDIRQIINNLTAADVGARSDTWVPSAVDVGAVSKTGDTLTGSLFIQQPGLAKVDVTNTAVETTARIAMADNKNAQFVNYTDDQNYNSFVLDTTEQNIENAIRFDHKANGTTTSYKVLHTGNRDLVSKTFTATVGTSWTADGNGFYFNAIALNGISADDNPVVDILTGVDNEANKIYVENLNKILRIETQNNQIVLTATEAISTAFPIQLKVVK